MNVLVVDIGGTNVKLMISPRDIRKFRSGKTLTPERFITKLKKFAKDWDYDCVSIGYPGVMRDGMPAVEPENLGRGWCDFDYAGAIGKPVKVMNDAAMQALGSYDGGRMLFLG